MRILDKYKVQSTKTTIIGTIVGIIILIISYFLIALLYLRKNKVAQLINMAQ